MLKRVIYHKLEKLTVTSVGPSFRKLGQNLFRTGTELSGDNAARDQLVKSMRCVPLNNKVYPRLLTADWVAPNATVIGDVELDSGSSIWNSAILRGDTAKITVGKNSLIQDGASIKSSDKGTGNVTIGNNVFVGPNAQIDSCTLDDFSYVGMGATVHKDAVVEPYAIVAAGAVIPEGTTVPSGQVWAGSPAQYLRDVTQEEKHQISEYVIEMQQLSQIYSEETEKTFREITDDIEEKERWEFIGELERKAISLRDAGMPYEDDDMEYISDLREPELDVKPDEDERTWNPYEQDLSRFPEIFKMYGENYDKYEKVKQRFDSEAKGEPMGDPAIDPKKPKDQSPWEKKYDDYMPRYRGESFQ